ncbi:GNAT family N-acetyltransferase [Bacillus sp. CGMCC 1.16607]|uniref:GNAT family N-acetyltransferase n=1 Tax=Bacillus sp. CGMCC 1.16607 TaxID=3351842 RepID=UPI003643581A
MIYELKPNEYKKIKPLLINLENHPVINGVIDGNNLGRIFVDHLDAPKTALVWAKMEMFFLIGDSKHGHFITKLESFIINHIKPEALAIGDTDFNLEAFPFHEWKDAIFRNFSVSFNEGQRVPFIFKKDRFLDYLGKSIFQPSDYSIRLIDHRVIENDNEKVIEKEILKFWESFDHFFQTGFGYCVTKGNEVIGSCISVFVTGNEYEIGINTYSTEHRGKGLATLMAREFICNCLEKGGIPHWTTEDFRKDSIAIANKLGFKQLPNYSMLYIPFKEWIL